MKKNPKFSIIIPVYNVENYLSQCLESVINQTLLDIEIICVNDGSKDRSRYILEKFQNKDHRIRIVDKQNGGLSSARNVGLNISAGEYILFLDSDDYLGSQTCERLYSEIIEHNPDIIAFGGNIFPEYIRQDQWLVRNLTTRSVIYDKEGDGIKALIRENGAYPFVWRNCFKRKFLIDSELIFDESVRFAEDLIFQFMAFPLSSNIVFISEKLYYYRWVRPNSLMDNASKDVYQKYCSHIEALHIIAEFWKSQGLLERYAKEFMQWTIYFMGWDLFHYKGERKIDLIKKMQDFWEKYDLYRYAKKITIREKVYYNYIKYYRGKGI